MSGKIISGKKLCPAKLYPSKILSKKSYVRQEICPSKIMSDKNYVRQELCSRNIMFNIVLSGIKARESNLPQYPQV